MTRVTEIPGNLRPLLRSSLALAALVLACSTMLAPTAARAQVPERLDNWGSRDESTDQSLFRILRIELSGFGGYVGGDQYLDLLPLLTDLTNDTALDEILDFSGRSPNPPLQAPKKKIEPGWFAGGAANFYLTPNFGMRLTGRYGQADALFRGRPERQVPTPDPDDDPNETMTVLDDELLVDQTTLSTYMLGAGIIYHMLSERKHSTRPFVTVGLGGIINQFENTDDTTALYFEYGLGVSFPIRNAWRGYVSAGAHLYTWDSDEVARDPTLQFATIQMGLIWRHEVPEDLPEDEFED